MAKRKHWEGREWCGIMNESNPTTDPFGVKKYTGKLSLVRVSSFNTK